MQQVSGVVVIIHGDSLCRFLSFVPVVFLSVLGSTLAPVSKFDSLRVERMTGFLFGTRFVEVTVWNI